MSRIGRLPDPGPVRASTSTVDGQHVTVKGPKGQLAHTVAEPITVARADDGIARRSGGPTTSGSSRALHGLSRTLVANMVTGVTDGYEKTLEIVGVGYRVQARGPTTSSSRSASATRSRVEAPEGITFAVETPTRFSVSGIDKQQVGEVAANIRKLRKPDPYKGKGVRYAGEHIRRKVGKAGK